MFTRVVEITAKTGKGKELTRTVNDQILPILKSQPGFVDELALVSQENPDRLLALSFWKTREDAEKYNREGFPRVNDVIRNLVETTPQVHTFDVVTSTIQKIAAGKAA
jgi:heme-degrading monooxygenase HmoA